MSDPGIDYGLGMSNVDHTTGIRFGVIPSHAVEYWYESAEADYGQPTCPKCGNAAVEFDSDKHDHYPQEFGCSDYACETCKISFDGADAYSEQALGYSYLEEGYKAFSSEDGDIFVERSPFFTYAPFCSPCAPGAVYLPTADEPYSEAYPKGYCFGHDWFDGKAPYPVYSVETGELVPPTATETE